MCCYSDICLLLWVAVLRSNIREEVHVVLFIMLILILWFGISDSRCNVIFMHINNKEIWEVYVKPFLYFSFLVKDSNANTDLQE